MPDSTKHNTVSVCRQFQIFKISKSHSNEMSIDNFKIPKIITPKKTPNLAQKIQALNLNQRMKNSQEKSEKKEKC